MCCTLGDFFTPWFERMAPLTEMRGHIIVVGDSGLALCAHQYALGQGAQCDCRGLESIVGNNPCQNYPGRIDFIVSWSGNDVRRPYGYLEYANARSSKSRIACVGLLSKRPECKGHWVECSPRLRHNLRRRPREFRANYTGGGVNLISCITFPCVLFYAFQNTCAHFGFVFRFHVFPV